MITIRNKVQRISAAFVIFMFLCSHASAIEAAREIDALAQFKTIASPALYAKIAPAFGRYGLVAPAAPSPGTPTAIANLQQVLSGLTGRAVTIGEATDASTPQLLTQLLEKGLSFSARFGRGTSSQTQIQICSSAQITSGKTAGCLDANDTVDWLVIQTAIFSVEPGTHVRLPKLAGDFGLNQSLSLKSGAVLKWVPDASGRYAYLRVLGTTASIGTLLTNYNAYGWHADTVNPRLVEGITLIQPHIDGGNVAGENAIGLARGARKVSILGGEIRNLRFHTTRFGGRAVQCEDGCEALLIRGLRITNASIGISSTVLRNNTERLLPTEAKKMMLSDVAIRDVQMDGVDLPFSFTNSKFGSSTEADSQKVSITNVALRNVGAITRSAFANKSIPYFSYAMANGTRHWCLEGSPALSELYQTSGDILGVDGSGIFLFQGGRNVTINSVSIVNDNDYPPIGGIVRGEFAANVAISQVSFQGKARALFNFTGGVAGPTVPAAQFMDATFKAIKAAGTIERRQMDLTRQPFSKAIVIGDGYGCSVPTSNAGRLQRIVVSDIVTENSKP